MGKKVKKKARSVPKEKRGSSVFPVTEPQEVTGHAETPVNRVVVVKDKGVCPHIDKGINLDKISGKLRSSESTACEDCRESVADRRRKKGQGKQGKKGGSNAKSLRAIWICLECGHYSCGGVGLPNTPQTHAVRHSKQNHHPLVVHFENHQLCWCFPCDKLVPGENLEDHKHKEVLNEVVKLLKGQPGEGSTLDVEDVWFGCASVTSAIKSDYSVSTDADKKAGYLIRGLCNLGNTCFFNSAMQNLLAINSLRDYFFKLDESIGPLTAAMKNLFLETSKVAGSKGVINPLSLFGSLCTKAPQFRGYQQHDSHELLRCLLDGMSNEELSTRKKDKSSEVSVKDPTFVDDIFGGQLSSTVRCLECGHSSTIYEPFLDLSLPVPTKKPPPKRNQPPIRGKKSKLPPKRSGRNLSKVSREANSVPRKSVVFDQATSTTSSSGEVYPIAQPAESLLTFGDSALPDSTDPNNEAIDMGLSAAELSAFQNPENQSVVQTVGEQSSTSDIFTWLDFLDPRESHEIDVSSETDDTSAIQYSTSEDAQQVDVLPSVTSDSRIVSNLEHALPETPLDNANANEHGVITQEQNASLQFVNKQNAKPHFEERILPEGSLNEDGVGYDAGNDHSSPSCSQICADYPAASGRDHDSSSHILDHKVKFCQNEDVATSSVELADTENSSAIVGNEQDSLDFGGFGDLFNEPEEFSAPMSEHSGSLVSDMAKNGVNGNTTESDPDEVDNADAPVTVEGCLAFFTKPELLSKDEHAWQCDNCSKILQEQRIKSSNAHKHISDTVSNGCENGYMNGLLDVGKAGGVVKSMDPEVDPSDGELLPDNNGICENGKCSLGDDLETEINGTLLQSKNVEIQATNAHLASSECSTISSQNLVSTQDKVGSADTDSDLLSEKCDSEAGEEEDVNSQKFKVKRDATKGILISKAPSVLTIHLKRFTQDARGRFNKLNGHVGFRETIQLKPYMDPRCTVDNIFKYRLVGVVEHSGTMRGGHYVAYVRGSKEYGDCVWYHTSDAYVRQASLDEVMRCEAYILFYERT